MSVDWGDGDYARTAALLAPAAEVLVASAGPGPGDRVLDVGCGTGNAALAAAFRGARVTAVDPSERLVAVARERAAEAGGGVEALVAEAEDLPFADAVFDVVISSFAVIFAPDPAAAVGEMVRVARHGGTVALSTWLPGGAIVASSKALRSASPPGPEPLPHWDDPEWVAGLMRDAGADEVAVERHRISFTADSPEAWYAEQEDHHPAWRATRMEIGEEAWAGVRERSLAALREGNEDPSGFRATSEYAIVRSVRISPAPGG